MVVQSFTKANFFLFLFIFSIASKRARSVRSHVSSAELHLRSWERFLHPLNHLFTKQVESEFWTRMKNLEPQVFGVSALELAIPPHMASLFMQALHIYDSDTSTTGIFAWTSSLKKLLITWLYFCVPKHFYFYFYKCSTILCKKGATKRIKNENKKALINP